MGHFFKYSDNKEDCLNYLIYLKMPARIIGRFWRSPLESFLMFCPSHQEFRQRNKMALYLLDSLVFVFGCQAKRDAIPLIWRRLECYGKYENIESAATK